jgi:hypothetical protein
MKICLKMLFIGLGIIQNYFFGSLNHFLFFLILSFHIFFIGI